MLSNRLIVGIDNEAIQSRLILETIKNALELAQGLEAVAKSMREIQNGIQLELNLMDTLKAATKVCKNLLEFFVIIVKKLVTAWKCPLRM